MRGLRGKSGAGGDGEQRGGRGVFPFRKIHEYSRLILRQSKEGMWRGLRSQLVIYVYKVDHKCAMCERLCEARA